MKMVFPWGLLDANRFEVALGRYSTDLTGNSVEAQVGRLYADMAWAVDMIGQNCPLHFRTQSSPWFMDEL